jgi:D-glycero-D-manno-heptose 1,7-bisphosphate phosphatase
MTAPAVFIDKDGTLIENVPYNADPALLRFMPGAPEALRGLSQAGYALIVVTNQAGLALGHFTRAQFVRLQAALQARLREEAGVELLDVVVCPHAPDAHGAPACLCRKPAPGMITRAALSHRIDLRRSWMVGDTLDDVEAGHRAGCHALLLDSGGETVWRRSPMRLPEAICADWHAVARHILQGPQDMPATPPAQDQPAPSALDRPAPSALDRPAPSALDRPAPPALDRPAPPALCGAR